MVPRLTFIWPREHYLPSSLFKHFAYLGEVAEYSKKLRDVSVVDLSVEPKTKNQLIELLSKSDFVLLPTEIYTVKESVKLSEFAHQVRNSITTISYGTVASMNPKVLSPHFDFVLQRDSWEKGIEKLVNHPAEFKKKLSGNIYSVEEPLPGDQWAFPALDILPLKKYLEISPNQLELRVQRGCNYNCSFCAEKYRMPGRKAYHRTPERVLEFLAKNEGYKFYLDAATFTIEKDWALETCKALASLNPKRAWRAITRVDKLDHELVENMAKAGCYKIGFGVESLNQSTQREIHKIVREEDITEVVKLLQEHKIIPRAFLILGLPGQTKEDVDYAQDFMKNLRAEYRWKEYVPVEPILGFKKLEEFDIFDRGTFLMHPVEGLLQEDYLKLLTVER